MEFSSVSFCFLTGINLTVVRADQRVNVSTSQDFTLPCVISRQSSRRSEFQVTWFRQDGPTGSKRRPIFAAYRNSTLQAFEKSDQLRFSRPSHNNYSLTLSKPAPEDSGVYFCEVQEWLRSPSDDWRKVATQMSGNLSLHVFPSGKHLII